MTKKALHYFLLSLALWLCASNLLALTITKSGGWLETAYVQWSPVGSTSAYTVTYTGGGFTNKAIDAELIRQYAAAGYWRADLLGLKAGTYSITVTGGGESATVNNVVVRAHDRSGLAHSPISKWGTASGAYNEDGTLITGAKVIYITASNNSDTQSYTLIRPDGSTATYTGIAAALLNAYQKAGTAAQPLAVRVIGKVTNAQIGVGTGTSSLLELKGKTDSTTLCKITIEGVGNDATAYGWGIKVVKCGNVEVRNLGIMGFGDDGTQIQDGNYNVWVHNCDYFYGAVGAAADQVKGDGSLDSKESGYCTYSYNHFWDSGKCNLLGMHDPIRKFLTYHHNWYDHSDSRHPRARVHWAHVYNNYYDGISGYGAGAAECSNLFCEGNYFKNTNQPMVISMQGNGGTTFSNEDGGMIKSWNNTLDNCTDTIPYSTSDHIDFDYYDATSRTEAVPATVKAKQGACIFTNINLADLNATPVAPAAARTSVMQDAGRCEGGDVKFQFTDADNPLGHDRIAGIGSVLDNYAPTGEIVIYDPNTGLPISGIAAPSLVLTSGNAAQTINAGTPITSIVYTASGTATAISVTGLPTGASVAYSGGNLIATITGTPSVLGATTYTVTATNGTASQDVSLTGTITVVGPAISLSSAVGTNAQTLVVNTSITNIVYTASGSATGATVSGLPTGVSSNLAGQVLTISGSPSLTGSFNYTVTTTGGLGTATATGIINATAAPLTCMSTVTILLANISSTGTYTLNLYNAAGTTLVKTLAQGVFQSGNVDFQFPANLVPSGSYTYKLLDGASVLKSGALTVP